MIVCHSNRLVIFAPWKTASQTVLARLQHYSEGSYSHFYEFNPLLQRVVHQHMTYADFLALPESRRGYRTAAFIRNPYDRVYSGFVQLQQDACQQPRIQFTDPVVQALVSEQLADNCRQLIAAGYEFDRWVAAIADHQVLQIGRNCSFPLHPCHYWTHHNGGQAVDFIGRVENFEHDFAMLCAKFELEPSGEANVNVKATDLEGDASGYRYAGRMNGASLAKINRLFRADFELFGYQMLPADAAPGS